MAKPKNKKVKYDETLSFVKDRLDFVQSCGTKPCRACQETIDDIISELSTLKKSFKKQKAS